MNILFILTVMYAATGVFGELCGIHSSSPTCRQLRQIQLSMDDTVDPCDDFYGYACNNWGLQHSCIQYNNPTELLDYQMNLNLISVLDNLEEEPLPLRILNETYNYYRSCLQAKGTNTLLAFLEIIKPGEDLDWPLLQELDAYKRGDANFSPDDWPAERFDPYALLGQLRNYDINDVLFKISLSTYSSGIVSTSMYQPLLSLVSQSAMLNILKELGFPHSEASKYSLHLKQTHDYWQNLRGMSGTSNILSYSELKERFPYFRSILGNIQIYRYNDNDTIVINNENYFQFLLEKQFSSAEKRNLCNYIMIRLLHYLQKSNVKSFTKVDCIKEVRDKLDLPVSVLYYGYIYSPEESNTNADIQAIFQKTRDYLLQRYEDFVARHSYKMSEIRKALYRICLNAGNMPKSMSVQYFDNIFGQLRNFYPNNYYANHLNLLQHGIRLRLMRYNKTHLLGSSSYIYEGIEGPFYDPNSKTVILQFMYLQPPIYHHSFDPIFKWSMLGYLLVKAFDSGLFFADPDSYEPLIDVDIVDIAYSAYVNETKSKVQPLFTNIPWKKLFILNLAQFFCAPNDALYREKHSEFFGSLRLRSHIFKEAFQCGANNKTDN